MKEEARKIRAEIAEIINENPSNLQDYDWISITNYFDTDYIVEVLKYIKDDDVCEEVKKAIHSAYIVAKRHYEKNTVRSVSSFDYELEKAGKMRALYVELQRHREGKIDAELKKKTDDVPNEQFNEINEEVETLKKRVRELEEELEEKKKLVAENEKKCQEYERLQEEMTHRNKTDVTKEEYEKLKKEKEDMVIELLTPIFYDDEQDARAFYQRVIHMEKGTDITSLVNDWVSDKKISKMSRKRSLYRILYAAKIYKYSETAWNQQVK